MKRYLAVLATLTAGAAHARPAIDTAPGYWVAGHTTTGACFMATIDGALTLRADRESLQIWTAERQAQHASQMIITGGDYLETYDIRPLNETVMYSDADATQIGDVLHAIRGGPVTLIFGDDVRITLRKGGASVASRAFETCVHAIAKAD